MEQPADILNFLLDGKVVGSGKCTVGNYTYLDGDLHVKLSLCSDAIISGLIKANGSKTSVAFLCTPTDLHVIPDEAYNAAKANASVLSHPLAFFAEKWIQVVTGFKFLKSNVMKPMHGVKLVDGISVAQGPNYALAKRMQHWRAMISFDAGCTVSSNIAPSTATISVTSNKMFARAYIGMPFFTPYEIFQQETTNAVMCAMLLHDSQNTEGSAFPANKDKYGIDNPIKLFSHGGFHGGVWRSAYTVDSIGAPSVIIWALGGPTLFLPIFYACTGVFTHFAYQFATSPGFADYTVVKDFGSLLSGN